MKKIIDKIPFLRLTAALSAGIVLGTFFRSNALFIFFLLVLITVLLLWLNIHYAYNRETAFGLAVNVYFIAAGFLLYNLYNKPPDFFYSGKFVAEVKEIIREKPNSYQSILKINSVLRNDSLFLTGEKVLAYFEKDENSKALLPGQTILLTSVPIAIKNSGNPFEFNYKRYMERRKIYRQVYISSDKWLLTCTASPFNLVTFSEKVRMKLLDIYNQQNWNHRQLNVLSALTLGYKHGLSPETKNTFVSAGAMHVLAVSGLHTGIVFLVISFLSGFLKKLKYGHFLFVFLVIAVLWGFAFLTGLSPSVMRAASMFSLVVIGQNLRKQANIYNTLAASAFFLLLLNPNNLLEAGFQLSYSAVFGIVFLQPKLERQIYFKYKISKYFWSLLTVSVAAQLATSPLSLFYFNQFPVYFWISNLLIIPAVTMLIPLGMGLLVFNSVSFLSALLAVMAGYILNFLLKFLEWVEKLPHAAINFYLTEIELFFVLLALLAFFSFIEFRKSFYFKSMLVFFLLFTSSSLIRKTTGMCRCEIIQYNYPGQNVVHLISGKRNYIVSDEALNENNNVRNLIQNTILGYHLNKPVYLTSKEAFNDSVLYLSRGLVLFEGQVVHFNKESCNEISPFLPTVGAGQVLLKKEQGSTSAE